MPTHSNEKIRTMHLYQLMTVVASVFVIVSCCWLFVLRMLLFIEFTAFGCATAFGFISFLFFPCYLLLWRSFRMALFTCCAAASVTSLMFFLANTFFLALHLHLYIHGAVRVSIWDFQSINLLILPWSYLWTRILIRCYLQAQK